MSLNKTAADIVRGVLVGYNEGAVRGVGELTVGKVRLLVVRWAAGSSACARCHVVSLSAVGDKGC